MKYSLTLHDLSAAQVVELANRFTETQITTNVVVDFKPGVIDASAAGLEAANQNLVAASASPADIESLLNDSADELLQSGKTGELDSEKMPWDERIHSASKKKNADGKWKLRKNVDINLVRKIQAHYIVSKAPPLPQSDFKDIPAFLQNLPVASGPVVVPATYVAPVAAPAPVMAQPLAPMARDFAGLMLKISNLFATKQITPDYPATIVNRVNQGFGTNIATLTDVQHDPRMVEYSWQCLDVDGKAA